MWLAANVDPASDAAAANVVLGWLDKVREYFKHFHPETKSMIVNYKNRRSEIDLLISIPDSLRRNFRSVEVPAYQNFQIYDMLDETLTRVGALWRFEDGKWKLDPSTLPKSEKYLLMLRGTVPQETLSQLVRFQPAVNRDQTEDSDRFWLDCMVRNVGLLEEIWKDLNIDEVNVAVKVGIERCFSTTLPKELGERVEITRQWIAAGRGSDRNELFRSWHRMRQASLSSDFSIEEILEVIGKLTSGEAFGSFVFVDDPFKIGEIRREDRFIGPFPTQMSVEASTELGLKKHTANGFLTFKKKEYNEEIRKSLDKLELKPNEAIAERSSDIESKS